jgi:hypothetical protein
VRGLTLGEKANGPGYRDRLLSSEVRVFERCLVEGCTAKPEIVLQLYVDAHPAPSERDWYSKMLRTLAVGVETECGFCAPHARDVIAWDLEFLDDPDLWEPGRANPPVLPGPGRLIVARG